MSRNSARAFTIPTDVLEICDTLLRADERAFIVGGVLRDMLAGREAGDFDIATTAEPKKVMRLFKRVVPTGLKHGTVTVLSGRAKFEITTLRGDGSYSDGRHPDSVEFLQNIEDDLARRDFTMNAMAWDPATQTLFDPFGGETDIANRIVRAVGDPAERFSEDGLRVLRAARFAAALGFGIEEQTLAAMAVAAPGLAGVSQERKRDELVKTLSAPKPSKGLDVMKRAGMLSYLCPELAELAKKNPCRGCAQNPWKQAMLRVDAVGPNLRMRLAALLLDVGAADSAEEWLKKMRFDNKIVESVPHIIRMCKLDVFSNWSDAQVRSFVQRAGREYVAEVTELKRADLAGGTDSDAKRQLIETLGKRFQFVLDSNAPLFAGELAIDGLDLMNELSLTPGPTIGRLLNALVDFVIDNPENNTRPKLLSRAKELVS